MILQALDVPESEKSIHEKKNTHTHSVRESKHPHSKMRHLVGRSLYKRDTEHKYPFLENQRI